MFQIYDMFNNEILGEFDDDRIAMAFANGWVQGQGKTDRWFEQMGLLRLGIQIKKVN